MVQDIVTEISSVFADKLGNLGVARPQVLLERSLTAEFGEYTSSIAMRYAKSLSIKPVELAETLSQALLDAGVSGVSDVQVVAPGFINIYLTTVSKLAHIKGINETQDTYGQNNLHKDEKWVIEHTSPNPNKAMHLGHLRNNLVGMSLVRLLKNTGAEVVSDCIYNDRGIAIAKVMYGFLVHQRKDETTLATIESWIRNPERWYIPSEKEQKPDVFVTKCYVKAEADMQNDEAEQLVRQMVLDWEAGDESTWKLWNHVLQFAYQGIDRTLARLGSHWDKVWYEHEHYKEGKDYVAKGLAQGVFQTLEDGAVLTNIEEQFGLPETVVLKKDGTSLYITQDLALTDHKKKFYDADKLIWVVGPEQSMAFKQLFAVCEQLGIGKREDFTHVTYGYVGLKDEDGSFKKMSSRAGTVVLIDDVIDTVKEMILARFLEEKRHEATVAAALAEKLALAAVKFSFLRSDRNQDLSFDLSQSVDVHGDSGMYVMYSFVRTQSILEKHTDDQISFTFPEVLGAEAATIRTLLYYPDVIKKAMDDLSVHHVAQYLLELSSEFNSWYAKETFLDGTDKEAYRVAIVSAVATTLQNGLSVLGIETVTKM